MSAMRSDNQPAVGLIDSLQAQHELPESVLLASLLLLHDFFASSKSFPPKAIGKPSLEGARFQSSLLPAYR